MNPTSALDPEGAAASVTRDNGEPGLQADQKLVDRGWLRIGAGLAVAAQAMVFSLAINVSEIGGWAYLVVHGILIVAAFATLALLGDELISSAWTAVRERRISIDLLFLVTLTGALVGSLVSTFTKTGSVYYEVVAILIVVHTAGKMLSARSRLIALRAAGGERERFDRCVVVAASGTKEIRLARTIRSEERVYVAAGAPICVDGWVETGESFVQETSMTGEWAPVAKKVGDQVWAGTYSIDGDLIVTAAEGPRKLDTLLAEVEKARLAPSALQEQADRLMGWFLPLVVCASVLTFLGWYWVGPWERALFNAMAVLLVACPCAMGLATPVAVWSGLARLAQLGLIARTGDFIDRLARTDVLCLDKTGTLSSSEIAVREWYLSRNYEARAAWVHQLVAATEEGLDHPIAKVLSNSLTPPNASRSKLTLKSRNILPGRGVEAVLVDSAGKVSNVRVGDSTLGLVPPEVAESITASSAAAKRVHVFVDGTHAAQIELVESWRGGLSETLTALSRLGVATEILSGDPQAEAILGQRVAASVRIHGGITPLQKSDRVKQLRGAGKLVAFAGDGMNDAAALAVADASIAVKSGSELARASAMAVMVGEDLRVLPKSITLSRAVLRSVKTNLRFAAAYNLLGCALAAAGLLHPVAAALLMLGSSLFVSVRGLRAK